MATPRAEQTFHRDAWAFSLLAFAYTLAWNWQHLGPAYLSDAVGYMVNAAILAGHHVDAMGSWHAGYSMLLWPLFWLDDPTLVWRGLLVVNAVLVAASVWMAACLLRDFDPQIERGVYRVILFLVVIYPSFSAIAGYGYSSPLITVLVLVIFRMIKLAEFRSWGFHFGLAALLGFTYWVHPIGIVFCLAAVLAYAVTYWGKQQLGLVAMLVVVPAVMGGMYKWGIHEWMYDQVTPDNLRRYDHYSALAHSSEHPWTERVGRIALIMMGQLSYQVIASFGMVALGGWSVVRLASLRRMTAGARQSQLSEGQFAALLFSVLSLLGVVAAGAWTFSWGTQTRIDHWIYGRYTDSMALPLLLYGYVTALRRPQAWPWWLLVLLPAAVLVAGFGLNDFADPGPAHSFQSTLAFWPPVVLPEAGYLPWFVLGAVGVVVVLAVCRIPSVAVRAVVLVGLAVLVAGKLGLANFKDHQSLLSGYSKPSAMVDIVRAGWPRGTCVGFVHPMPSQLPLMHRERYRMYAFYLFNYNYHRQSVEQWRDTCDGPLFTYMPQFAANDPTLDILAREVDTGLYLIARSQDRGAGGAGSLVDVSSRRGGVVLGTEVSKACLIAGCFALQAAELANTSQVGALNESRQQLLSDGRAGFLFYGPYRPLEAGAYRVRLQGDFSNTSDVTLDVASHGGKTIHATRKLDAGGLGADQQLLEFELTNRVETLEVRMRVGRASLVAVTGYDVELLSD